MRGSGSLRSDWDACRFVRDSLEESATTHPLRQLAWAAELDKKQSREKVETEVTGPLHGSAGCQRPVAEPGAGCGHYRTERGSAGCQRPVTEPGAGCGHYSIERGSAGCQRPVTEPGAGCGHYSIERGSAGCQRPVTEPRGGCSLQLTKQLIEVILGSGATALGSVSIREWRKSQRRETLATLVIPAFVTGLRSYRLTLH